MLHSNVCQPMTKLYSLMWYSPLKRQVTPHHGSLVVQCYMSLIFFTILNPTISAPQMNFGANRKRSTFQNSSKIQNCQKFSKIFDFPLITHIDLGISSSFNVPSSFQNFLAIKKPVIENQGSADRIFRHGL